VNPTKPDSHAADASHPKTLTDWYPADVKPVREGVYDTLMSGAVAQCLWNGDGWYYARGLFKGAYALLQDRQWRGLTEQSK